MNLFISYEYLVIATPCAIELWFMENAAPPWPAAVLETETCPAVVLETDTGQFPACLPLSPAWNGGSRSVSLLRPHDLLWSAFMRDPDGQER